VNRSLENWAYIGVREEDSNNEDSDGVRFSLSLSNCASGTAAVLRFFADLGRDNRLARLVDDFVFFGFPGLPSFVFACLSVSLPVRDFRDIVLLVFLGEDFASPSDP
jgi:hypothetical protein